MRRPGTFRWTAREVWRRAPRLTLALAATVLLRGAFPAAVALATGRLVGALTDAVGTAEASAVWVWLGVLVGAGLGEGLATAAQTYLKNRLSLDLGTSIELDLTAHAAALPFAALESIETQNLTARARGRAVMSVAAVATGTLDVATLAAQAASLAAVLLWVEPLAVALVLAVGAGYGVFRGRLAGRLFRVEAARTGRRREAHYYQGLVMSHGSAAEVQLLGLGPRLVARARRLVEAIRDEDVALFGTRSRGDAAVHLVVAVVTFGLLARVATRVVGGALGVGEAVAFLVALGRFQRALNALVGAGASVRESLLFVHDLRRLLGIAPAAPAAAGALPDGAARLVFDDVTFTYPGAGRPAVEGVSFEVAPGEVVALVGENAAGKSTLVKLAAGLYAPTSGRVLYGGVDLSTVDPAAWRRRLAVVLQRFNRYEATAAENIAFGDAEAWLDAPPDAVAPFARGAGADAFVRALPDGYATPVGRAFGLAQLSGGQWQRMALARGLARTRSEVVLMDEPGAHLDARAQAALFDRFRALCAGRAALVISHRLSAARDADRIVVLDAGRVVEQGAHAELVAQGGLYAALFALQADRYADP